MDAILALIVGFASTIIFLIGWTSGYKQGHRDGYRWGKSVKVGLANASK